MKTVKKIAEEWEVYYYESGEINNDVCNAMKYYALQFIVEAANIACFNGCNEEVVNEITDLQFKIKDV